MKIVKDLPTVLIRLAIVVRELDSKLVLASMLAKKGFRVIIGHKEPIKAIGSLSKNVIWFGKGSLKGNPSMYDKLKENGSPLLFIHDEGAMFRVASWEEELLHKYSIEHLQNSNASRVCVWGERQKSIISERCNSVASKIRVTGVPMLDLCRPKYDWLTDHESYEIMENFKPFILINTRFTSVAHSEGIDNFFLKTVCRNKWRENDQTNRYLDQWFSRWNRDVHDFADYVLMVKELAAAYPKYKIILRPHPSESTSFYEKVFSSHKNVVVCRLGQAIYWIRSAELVIHCNCTTGIEAVLAGKPVINFTPDSIPRGDYDVEVAREAGYKATTIEQVLMKVNMILDGEKTLDEWSSHATDILYNLKQESIPVIVDEIFKVSVEENISASKTVIPKTNLKFKKMFKKVNKSSDQMKYSLQKRGLINADHVEAVLEGCKNNSFGIGKVEQIAEDYIVITP